MALPAGNLASGAMVSHGNRAARRSSLSVSNQLKILVLKRSFTPAPSMVKVTVGSTPVTKGSRAGFDFLHRYGLRDGRSGGGEWHDQLCRPGEPTTSVSRPLTEW